MKFLKPLIFTILLLIAGWVNHPAAWSFIIAGIIWDIHYRYEALNKQHDESNSKMGVRLIDGMKAMTDLMRNAFDHIKTNAAKIEKLNGKLTENNSKLHLLSQSQHRVVGQRNKTTHPTDSGEDVGAGRPTEPPLKNVRGVREKSKRMEQNVRDIGDKS